MKAAVYHCYGPADVVRIAEVPDTEPAAGEVLVRTAAAAVTTADWRLRASAFPGGLWLAGRLMTGLLRPRKPILGSAFAGTVAALGPGVSGFEVGDRVFGFAPNGAHAEFLTIAAEGAIAPMPEGLTFEEAAALPFGGDTALVFLRDIIGLRAGHRILVLGATGAAGSYAIQIARSMGAEVTAVASGPNEALVRRLGADDFIDYRASDPLSGDRTYDAIFDTVGAATFASARKALKENGIFAPLNFSVTDALRGMISGFGRGKKMKIAVSNDTRAHLDELSRMIDAGTLRPVLDRSLPFDDIREAHRLVETRHRRGTLVIRIASGQTPPAQDGANPAPAV